ncbi:MAG: AMP-binding protein, partial [Proteobacteria bacterium]|nr:AMP-binding protein [Pseudomonadota bacterium]
SWLWEIHRRRGTLSGAPNFAFELCANRIDDDKLVGLDLSSARMIVNGAEPVRPQSVRAFCERFAPYGLDPKAIAPVYGLAENSVGLAFPPPGRGLVTDCIDRTLLAERSVAKPVSPGARNSTEVAACGVPIPGHQFRVVDNAGREVGERHQGRLQFSGPSATRGYYRNQAKTRDLINGAWLETGDLAYIAGGDVYLTGRVKDIIIQGGRNIYPHEVEAAVGQLEGVRQGCVAVFAASAEDQAEKFVVVAETRETAEDVRRRLKSEINAIALDVAGIAPDDVVVAPPGAVLKTSIGKIRRSATADRYVAGRLSEPSPRLWWQVVRLALSGAIPGIRAIRRVLLNHAYAGYWWAVLLMLAMIVWPLSLALPRQAWRWWLVRLAARLMLRLTGISLTVEGDPARAHRGIVVANHGSYIDSLVLVAALPEKLDFVAKAELAPQVVAGTFLRRIGTLFVERFYMERGVDDTRTVIDAARQGRRLVIYPEGTLTRRPGLLGFKLGAFAAAATAGVPIVPITLRGTRSILRGGQWFPRRGVVSVTIGAALTAESDGFDAAVKLRNRARAEILKGCGEPDLVGEATLLKDLRNRV